MKSRVYSTITMSNLPPRYQAMLEKLFNMQEGYLLGFTNESFKNFMLLSAGIDVYTAPGYKDESSKAKKFRFFLRNETDALVGKIILELLPMRIDYIKQLQSVDEEYIDLYSKYVTEIESIAQAMCTGSILPKDNDARLEAMLLSASSVLTDICDVCDKVCNNSTFNYDCSENQINDYFRDILEAKGYNQVLDQTRHGISANGKDSGEVDILLKKDDKEIAIIEGLKLDCVNKKNINDHINKAVINYNALGTPTFIIAYVGAANFQEFCCKAYEYLKIFTYPLEIKKEMEEIPVNAAVRCASIILSKDGFDFPTYFIAVNIGCKHG